MVKRWTRFSRYSGVISSADSSRTPPSIFAIISRARSLMGSPPTVKDSLLTLDDADGLALRARQGPRRDEREAHREPERLPQALGHARVERHELGMPCIEAAAALDDGGRRLDLDLERRERGRAVDDELVVGHELRDLQQRA